MNNLKHYLEEVDSVTDITEEYSRYAGWKNSAKPVVLD